MKDKIITFLKAGIETTPTSSGRKKRKEKKRNSRVTQKETIEENINYHKELPFTNLKKL